MSRTFRLAAAVLLGLAWFAGRMWSQAPALKYATRLAGTGHDSVAGIVLDRDGNTWIAGTTSSVDFPTLRAKQPRPAGSSFLRIEGTGSSWVFDSSVSLLIALAASPTVPDLVYASDSSGLHKSADGGDTWTLLPAQPSAHPPSALALDSTAAAVLFAGSADGIFKSSDGGATWGKADRGVVYGSSPYIAQVAVDPFDPQIVFAVVNNRLFRSTDAGASWIPLFQAAGSVSFDLGRSGVVFLSANGIYKSTDHGAQWTQQGTSLVNPVFPDPFHPGTLYTSFAKSTDDGMTWTSVPGFGSYFPFFAADFSSRSVYASFGTTMVRSADGFVHQETVSPPAVPFMRVFGTGVGRAPGSPLRIYAGTEITSDLFVAKLDANGNVLYSSYLGGSSGESATALAVDGAGNLYVTGLTSSLDFPVTPGAYATTFQDAQASQLASLPVKSAFVVKLNSAGDIVYSTFFAGRCTSPTAIAVDAGGSVFLTGITSGDLPVTPGAYQSNVNPPRNLPCDRVFGSPLQPAPLNGFMLRFDASGSSLQASTYLGAIQEGDAIAVDASGVVYVGGGNTVIAVNAAGTALLGSTKLDGASVTAMVLDSSQNLYVTGSTQSSAFPTTPGAVQRPGPAIPKLPGGVAGVGPGDVFVTKLASDLSIVDSAVLGGEAVDTARGIAIDPSGNVTIAGSTASRRFPLATPFQSIFNTATGFVARLSADFSNLDYSTYAGNRQGFSPTGVTLDGDGNPVFSGYTLAPGGPILNEGPPLPDNATGVWVARLSVVSSGVPSVPPVVNNVVNAASRYSGAIAPGETVSVLGSGFDEGSQLLLDGNILVPLSRTSTEMTVGVPASYQGGPDAVVQVKSANGQISNRFLLPVAAAAIGLYSADASGFAQGYILNADGTRNSPDNPAPEGSIITIFATGVGPTTKVSQTDVTASPANVFIDGFYANGVDARVGPVPGLPGDVYQLKIVVPRPSDFADINPNLKGFKLPPTVGVVLNLADSSSQSGVSISVQ